MTDFLHTDLYVNVNRDCPIRTDLHPADDFVEIIFGEHRFAGNALRLVIKDPDTLLRLTEAFRAAHVDLVEHLHSRSYNEPAASEKDVSAWARTGS